MHETGACCETLSPPLPPVPQDEPPVEDDDDEEAAAARQLASEEAIASVSRRISRNSLHSPSLRPVMLSLDAFQPHPPLSTSSTTYGSVGCRQRIHLPEMPFTLRRELAVAIPATRRSAANMRSIRAPH